MCMVDPQPSSSAANLSYLWTCSNCFADGLTMPTIIRVLSDVDTAMINCTATIDGVEYRSNMAFNLQVQGKGTYSI